jgi:hypothetical protein
MAAVAWHVSGFALLALLTLAAASDGHGFGDNYDWCVLARGTLADVGGGDDDDARDRRGVEDGLREAKAKNKPAMLVVHSVRDALGLEKHINLRIWPAVAHPMRAEPLRRVQEPGTEVRRGHAPADTRQVC